MQTIIIFISFLFVAFWSIVFILPFALLHWAGLFLAGIIEDLTN